MPFELHELFGGSLKLYQPKRGYRFSIDAILLAAFAAQKAHGTVADLGAGSGVVSLVLAKNRRVSLVVAFEIQDELAEIAKKNVVLNHCEDKITIEHGDIRQVRKKFSAGQFDAVVTNPPFYAVGTGRINPHSQKAAARHEMHGTLDDFIASAAFLLKTGGTFFVVYSADRIIDLFTGMREAKIEPKVLRSVHPKAGEPATMVLVEGIKGAGVSLKILNPLFVYDSDGNYTSETKEFYKTVGSFLSAASEKICR